MDENKSNQDLLNNIDIDKKDKNKNKNKLNYIDKLFIRIFLSSLLLFSLVIINKPKLKNMINKEMNFLSYAKIFNGVFDGFIPVSDEVVYNKNAFDNVVYLDDVRINEVHNYTINYIHPLVEGVVTKIYKDKNGLYSVYIKSIDGFTYIYEGLETIDVSIYSFVTDSSIIGSALYDNNLLCFKFNLIIEKDGEYFSYYENAED